MKVKDLIEKLYDAMRCQNVDSDDEVFCNIKYEGEDVCLTPVNVRRGRAGECWLEMDTD